MNTYSVDTNAILRFLLLDNVKQGRAVQELFHEAKREGVRILIEEVVFVESVYVLSKLYKFPKSVIAEKLIGITNLVFIDISVRDIVQSALTVFMTKNISFVDSLLLVHAQVEHIRLYTFDKKLAKEAKRMGLAA